MISLFGWMKQGRKQGTIHSKPQVEVLESRTLLSGSSQFIAEPNDTPAQAFDSGIDGKETAPTTFIGSGKLGDNPVSDPSLPPWWPHNDTDYIRVNLNGGDRIGIGLFVHNTSIINGMYLEDASGQLVATDQAFADDPRIPFPDDPRLQDPQISGRRLYDYWTAKDSGNYFVVVSGASDTDSSGHGTPVDYDLEIRVVPRIPLGPPNGASGVAPAEPNDTIHDATPISVGPFGVDPAGNVTGEYYQSAMLGDNPDLPPFGNSGQDVDMYKLVIANDPPPGQRWNVSVTVDVITADFLANNPFAFRQPTPSIDEMVIDKPLLRLRVFDDTGQDITEKLDLSLNGSVTEGLDIFANFPAPTAPTTYYLGINLGGDYDPNVEGSGPQYSDAFSNEVPYLISAMLVPTNSPPVDQLPAITPTSPVWDTAQGGVDFGYQVSGADLTQATTAALYWSSTDQWSGRIGNPVYTQDIPTGTQTGSYGPFNVSASQLGTPPQGAKYLLEVTDPNNVLGNFDPSKNVIALNAIPDIVMNGSGDEVTTKDATNLSITYDINNANINDQALNFKVYRSATQYGQDTLIATGTLAAADVQDLTIGHHADVPLTLQYVDPNGPQDLPIDPEHPYIVVEANPDNSISEKDTSNDTAEFRKYVIGVVTHGQQLLPVLPSWVNDMANGLKQYDGYNDVIPFDWSARSLDPYPTETTVAGSLLAETVELEVASLSGLAANDVVDLHFIGHSRGAVVISQALQDLRFTTDPHLIGGYKKMTMLDPHPAHNYDGAHWYSEAPTLAGFTAINGVVLPFQAGADDPSTVIPNNVNEAEVYYQHTPSYMLSGQESVFNLWGEVPVTNQSTAPVIYDDLTGLRVDGLTGPYIGHSEIHDWYYDNVVSQGLAASFNPQTAVMGSVGVGAPVYNQPAPRVESVIVNDGSAQRSSVTKLTITFNTLVTIDDGAILVGTLGGDPVDTRMCIAAQGGKTVVTLTFSLLDGRYALTIDGNNVFNTRPEALDGDNDGLPGGIYVYSFHQLLGDFNGDGVVSALDQRYWTGHIGKTRGQIGYDALFDFNGDGIINIADYVFWTTLLGHRV